jgi:hypothetical protein
MFNSGYRLGKYFEERDCDPRKTTENLSLSMPGFKPNSSPIEAEICTAKLTGSV